MFAISKRTLSCIRVSARLDSVSAECALKWRPWLDSNQHLPQIKSLYLKLGLLSLKLHGRYRLSGSHAPIAALAGINRSVGLFAVSPTELISSSGLLRDINSAALDSPTTSFRLNTRYSFLLGGYST